ncbi:MAG: hypothetical protein J6K90_01570 [Tidjanibacter sp.]|nr:hypothetical protein [Tidjanibacter sp.]MBR6831768.1 hypothetical protein [Tidjanibacter sp.]
MEDKREDRVNCVAECVADDELLLQFVVCGDGELLFLDTWLGETFRSRG